MPRITQKDISVSLGVDKSTVSLALRDHPSISTVTCERVKVAAAKMGYRPDPALSNLARQRWAGHTTGSGAAMAYLERVPFTLILEGGQESRFFKRISGYQWRM
ncbi:MAG: LacI family DNA-binding transcriptional regulator [Candidatus Synoicihabitans palmerolidicus]|nr:LacI family DNA-binding transcriptional regulator [Candidatus Synoicihabitans palmerolidicus]